VTVLLLLAVAVLIAIIGFFVAAEFGLVRSKRSSLQDLADNGNAGAQRALELHDDLNEYLSACQFGITLASLGIGFLGEPAIAELFEPLFGDAISHGLSVALSIAIAYIIVTGSHVVLGEQVPKIYSIIHPDKIAILVARPLRAFDRGMKPFIALLNMVSNAILRLLRVDPNTASEEGATPEELQILISQARAGGKLDPGEAGMLTGVFHLHEQEARQVMTPIPAVVTVDLSEDVANFAGRTTPPENQKRRLSL